MSGRCGLGFCPYERPVAGAREGALITGRVQNSPYEARVSDLRGARISFNNNPEGRTYGDRRGASTTRMGDRRYRNPTR